MFDKGETVLIVENEIIVDKGILFEVCKDKNSLLKYFTSEHPLFEKFSMHIRNNSNIYIIDRNFGRSGHTKKELRKIKKFQKNHI